jgi:hypothetical protein
LGFWLTGKGLIVIAVVLFRILGRLDGFSACGGWRMYFTPKRGLALGTHNRILGDRRKRDGR